MGHLLSLAMSHSSVTINNLKSVVSRLELLLTERFRNCPTCFHFQFLFAISEIEKFLPKHFLSDYCR